MNRISTPGTYLGYSHQQADGYIRRSEYVAVQDGCRLAVDTYLPTSEGNILSGPIPMVAVCTGYRRAWRHSEHETERTKLTYAHIPFGEIATWVNHASHIDETTGEARWMDGAPAPSHPDFMDWLAVHGSSAEYLLAHGYAFSVIDLRGTGASFGSPKPDGWAAGQDLHFLFDWYAKQPWCSGNIGMIGSSWLGGTQYYLLNHGSPHFKAAIPQMAGYDPYDSFLPGGMYNVGLFRDWSRRREKQESLIIALPVTEDPDGVLLKAAFAERGTVEYPTDEELDNSAAFPGMNNGGRDELMSMFELDGLHHHEDGEVTLKNLPLDFDRANLGSTAVYFWGGLWDFFPRGTSVCYANYSGPKKLILGPWHHANYWDTVEALRWFDYWLKGIENGIMDEPNCVFVTSDADRNSEWRGASDWPLAAEAPTPFYFGSSKAGSELSPTMPSADRGEDRLVVNYEASAGTGARGYYDKARPYLDYAPLVKNAKHGLSYTSEPSQHDTELTGHPVGHLFFQIIGSPRIGVFLFGRDSTRWTHYSSERRRY